MANRFLDRYAGSGTTTRAGGSGNRFLKSKPEPELPKPKQTTGAKFLNALTHSVPQLARQTAQSASDVYDLGKQGVLSGLFALLSVSPVASVTAGLSGRDQSDVRTKGLQLAKETLGTRPEFKRTNGAASFTTNPSREPIAESARAVFGTKGIPLPARYASVAGYGGLNELPGLIAASGATAAGQRVVRATKAFAETAAQLNEARSVLGVSKNAGPKAIERAARNLLSKYHPDIATSPDPGKTQAVIEARDLLLRGKTSLLSRLGDAFFGKSAVPAVESPALLTERAATATPVTPRATPTSAVLEPPRPVTTAKPPFDLLNGPGSIRESGGPLVPIGKPAVVSGAEASAIRARNAAQEAQNARLAAFQASNRGEVVPSPKYSIPESTAPKSLRPGVTIPTRQPGGAVKPIRYASRPIVLPETPEEARYIDQITKRGAIITKEFLEQAPAFRRPSKAEQQFVSFHRVIDYADPSGVLRKTVVRPVDLGIEQAERQAYDLEERLKSAAGGIKKNSSADKQVFRAIEGREQGKLTGEQRSLKRFAETTYADLLDRMNRARAAIKKAPIPRRQDYVTHVRELSFLEGLYGDPLKIPDEELIALRFAKPNSPAFKFATERLGGRFAESTIGALQAYIRPALRHIHLTGPVTNARAHIRFLTDNEPLNTFLTDYIDQAVLNRPTRLDSALEQLPLVSTIMKVTDRLVSMTGAGVILGNISSVLNNLGGLVQSAGELGPYFAAGLKRSLDAAYRRHAIAKSGVVFGRYRGEIDVGLNPWQNSASLLKQGLGFLFKQIEIENVMTAWLGAEQRAIADGLSSEQAIEAADTAALRTQGGYAKTQAPAIFRNKSLRAFNQFTLAAQNFYLQLGYDPIRLGHEPGAKTKALRLLIFALLADAGYRKVTGRPLFFGNPLERRGTPAAYRAIAGLSEYAVGKLTDDLERQRAGKTNLLRGAVTLIPGGGQGFKTYTGLEALERGFAVDASGRKSFDVLTAGDKIRVLTLGATALPPEQRKQMDAFAKYEKRFAVRRDRIVTALLNGDKDGALAEIANTASEMSVPVEAIVEAVTGTLTGRLEDRKLTTVMRKFQALPKPVKLQVIQLLK